MNSENWDKRFGHLSNLDQKAVRVLAHTQHPEYDEYDRTRLDWFVGWWWWKPTATPLWRACRTKHRVEPEAPEPWFSWEQQLNRDGEWEIVPGSTQQHRTRVEAEKSMREREEAKAPSALDELFKD
jgi:hypothetical protein